MGEDQFIPCTIARDIGDGIFFRPIRSWHSATFAGEKVIERTPGGDRSGCMWPERVGGLEVCCIPYTVTHRLYWHESAPENTVSAFLSYPNAMGFSEEYFWEENATSSDDVTRWFGPNAEQEMEVAIKAHLIRAAKGEKP